MEAVVSITSESMWKQFASSKLRQSKESLRTYTNKHIEVLGEMAVVTQYGIQKQSLDLVLPVMAGNGSMQAARSESSKIDWPKGIYPSNCRAMLTSSTHEAVSGRVRNGEYLHCQAPCPPEFSTNVL